MKTPRFFLGAVVLFWGRQVDLLWIALILALILESARMVKTRFELAPSDFNKFVDISTVLLAGTVVIALTMETQKSNLVLLRWLPLIFFPIVAAQEFSAKGRMDIKSFFLTARKKVEMRFYETREIDVSYIYAFFCIMSSAFANTKGSLYFFSAGLFFVWGLWPIRSRRVPPVGWVLCILIVMILGYEGQTAVRAAGRAISNRIMSYYARYHMTDPFKAYTALGEIGDLKFSDEIVLRASFDDYVPGTTYLLHNASYNRFSSSNWFAKHGFERILNNGTFWQVNPPVENSQKMILYFRLQKGKAVLSLPPGVIDISEMKAGGCEKNVMQAIRIEDGPSLIKAVVSYTGSSTFDAPPEPDDTFLPLKERPLLKIMAEKLAFENKSEEEILKTVYSFFQSEFTYSLDLKGKGKASTPLENFFLNTKSGHCEFFATATVLLMRQAGIPARYATGFIAHEYSNLEDCFVVRMRDAHAWAKVFVNGQWRNIDTTPASFLNFDSDKIPTSLLEDILSFFGFKLSQLRHETGAMLMEAYGPWLTLPLGLILFLRLRKAGQIKKIRDQSRPGKGKKRKEKPTGFYRIEEILTEKGFPRHPYETYAEWLKRISRHLDGKELTGHLFFILGLHNQWRFGKPEHMEERKRELDERVAVLLTKLSAVV